jgi:hypothetical protein
MQMQYFIHVVTDNERIVDPDGAVFVDLEQAKVEATQSARDLMAEELRCGRRVPVRWRVQIADESGAVVDTIRFASLLFGNGSPGGEASELTLDTTLIERAKATFARVRHSHSELNDGLVRLKGQLRTLALFNASLGRGPSNGL